MVEVATQNDTELQIADALDNERRVTAYRLVASETNRLLDALEEHASTSALPERPQIIPEMVSRLAFYDGEI